MTHVKSYVKWLSEKGYLQRLTPSDVPRGKVKEKIPEYLTKQELAKIFQHLEQRVSDADKSSNKLERYSAYLRRAVARMLYTTGLRNYELRSLTYDDINIEQLRGIIFGK